MIKRLPVLLLFLVVASGRVWACGCVGSAPGPCKGLSATDVIFVGRVLQIDNPPSEDVRRSSFGESRYRFHVDEKMSGALDEEVDIYSLRDGDCGYHFRLYEQYVVFPYRNSDGRLFATICSLTRPIELAQAILPELRDMRDHQRKASLYGILRAAEQPYESVTDDLLGKPLTNTRVELRSPDRAFAAQTDSNGVYAFYDVPGGEYRVQAELPKNLELAQEILNGPLSPLELPADACYEYNVTALPTGRIRGRVLGPNGKPLSFASVELFRREKYSRSLVGVMIWSEYQEREKKYFEFDHVGPGDYILVFNNSGQIDPDTPYPRSFYPGVSDIAKAKLIHVEPGGEVSDADIRVSGGRPTRELTVRLIAETGKLPNINYVETKGRDGSSPGNDEVAPGVYKVSLFKGVHYELHGEGYCSATNEESKTDSVEVEGSDAATREITLIFRGAGCGE